MSIVASALHYRGTLRFYAYVWNDTTGCIQEIVLVRGAMVKPSEIIVMEMLEFIQREGGHPKIWCIGLTNDPRRRLFDEHQVHYQNDAWIYRTAASEAEALYVQTYFSQIGLYEVGGELRSGYRMVYAYKKSINTKP